MRDRTVILEPSAFMLYKRYTAYDVRSLKNGMALPMLSWSYLSFLCHLQVARRKAYIQDTIQITRTTPIQTVQPLTVCVICSASQCLALFCNSLMLVSTHVLETMNGVWPEDLEEYKAPCYVAV